MLDFLFGQFAQTAAASWPALLLHGGQCAIPGAVFSELAEILEPQILVHKVKENIQAWAPEGSVQCSAPEALVYYDQGCSLYIPHIEHVHPALGGYLRSLEAELGVPKGSGHCSIFAGRCGSRVAPHCDHDFGFNLLLRGRKQWRVSNDGALAFPLRGHQLGRPLHDEQAANCIVPQSMTGQVEEFEHTAGECVFVPAGVWHETHLLEDCVSLDFAIDPPRLADAISERFGMAVRRKLLDVSQYRRPLDTASRRWLATRADEALDSVAELLQEPLRTEFIDCACFCLALVSQNRGKRTQWTITAHVHEQIVGSIAMSCATDIAVTQLLRNESHQLRSFEQVTQLAALLSASRPSSLLSTADA